MSVINYSKTVLADLFNRLASSLVCRENISMSEYQFWLDKYPVYKNGYIEKVKLLEKLNEDGTNDVFKAISWACSEKDHQKVISPTREIVIKLMVPYVPKSPDLHHQLSLLFSSFYDEIRINNLIASTNIEGVIQPCGGGRAGKMVFLKMEYIKGVQLDKTFRSNIDMDETIQRIARLAYLANSISQLHYYKIIHKDLKPRNLMLCLDAKHKNNQKILIGDFGYANSVLRDSINEYGGQLTPCYSAPEQALMTENLTESVDYFAFGVIMHEYLTGKNIFPEAMNLFIKHNYQISEEYLEHMRSGRQNIFDKIPEVRELINKLTTFDSNIRLIECKDLFDIAHRLKQIAIDYGYRDINIDFLENQLEEYKSQQTE